MLKARQRLCLILIDSITAVIFLLFCFFFLPSGRFIFSIIFATWIFISLQLIGRGVAKYLFSKIEEDILHKKETVVLSDFIQKLRFCYSLDDFFSACTQVLEVQGDCSVLFIDKETNYIIYNSPDSLTCRSETMEVLSKNFSNDWNDGVYFFDKDFGLISNYKSSRGFFLVLGHYHFYVFCRYTRLFDKVIYQNIYEELVRFLNRQEIISNLSEITELSHEWAMLADVQKSFLPRAMPKIPSLELASYFRPLVNVSGDYYTVLPLNEHKTLVMLGDVSGKGLAAALVMGLVLNTLKVLEDKEDLVGVVYSIDRAIKKMKLQDKYTVLFIGIIDTQKMKIRYINASMSDPIVVTPSPNGYRIKPLSSNCSLIGIIELDGVMVAEEKLFRGDLILMASDGVSEAMDKEGIELGSTELYVGTIKNSASKPATSFVSEIANLVLSYTENNPRDDITMLVAKVEG